jgi:hypothetical protein
MRLRNRLPLLMVLCLLASAVLFVEGPARSGTQTIGPAQVAADIKASEGPPLALHGLVADPDGPYPVEWEVAGVDEARSIVDFPVHEPDHPNTSPDSLDKVYVFPSGDAVSLVFAPAGKPSEPVRQEYIELYQARWLDEEDPRDTFKRNLDLAPDPNKVLMSLEGHPALAVMAHSPEDVDRANPAFLRFVVDGLDVQLSGGDDLDLLVDIARSLLRTIDGEFSPSS